MILHRRLSLLLIAFLAAGAWSHASTEHRRPLRNPEVRRPISRAPSPKAAFLPGDEFMVDTTLAYGLRNAEQLQPSVAFDGTDYLVVWLDGYYNIRAARVRQDGLLLDPSGIGLGGGAENSFPQAVFDGTDFFVVWSAPPNIMGSRITPEGQVLDPYPITVSSRTPYDARCSIAWGGSEGLVVWTDSSDGPEFDIYGTRVTRSGVVCDSLGMPVSTWPGIQMSPAVAFDGNHYLVVWQDYRNGTTADIYGARVDTSGTVADTSGFPVSLGPMSQLNPALAFGDSVYLVAWEDVRIDPNRDIYCARVAPDARVLDSAGIKVTDAVSSQLLPKVAFDGMDYMLDWADWRSGAPDIYGARVSQAGVLLDTAEIPICVARDYQDDPGIVFGDTNCLAVWHDYRYGDNSQIFGARVNRVGRVMDSAGFIVSMAPPASQDVPCAAFTGSSYVVAWALEDDPMSICFSRLAPDGGLLDSAPHTLCPSSASQDMPAVAVGDSCVLVVWVDYGVNGLAGARVTQSGAVLDSTGISIMSGQGTPDLVSVAGGSENWLVVWDESNDSGQEDVRAARVSSAGTVLDTSGIQVRVAAWDEYIGQVASGDSGYLVVWTDAELGWVRIFAGRVTRSGAVLDSAGIQVSFDSAECNFPHVAFGVSGYLVVWQEKTSYDNYEICGARLDRSGAVLDSEPILIASPGYYRESPSVTFDGTDYIVAWQDSLYSGISGARVSRWGTVLGTFPISRRDVQSEFCLAAGPNRQVLALYSAFTDSVNHRPVSCNRIWGRLSPFEGIEEVPTGAAPRMTLGIMPNPLSGNGEVRYSLPVSGRVRLGVYDVSGRLVRLLADDEQRAGSHVLRWDGTDENLRKLPNGVCFVRLETAGRCESRVVIIAH
jgi:hypothetical protein